MSRAEIRRGDLTMEDDEARRFLARGRVARVATADAGGEPYVVPMIYACGVDYVLLHSSGAGRFHRNILARPRICLEVSVPGPVFPYGSTECDSTMSYESVIVAGPARVVTDRGAKQHFFDQLMAKYSDPALDRPKSFYPRIDIVAVYRMTIEDLCGKRVVLPPITEQWPAVNRSRTPNAVPPA